MLSIINYPLGLFCGFYMTGHLYNLEAKFVLFQGKNKRKAAEGESKLSKLYMFTSVVRSTSRHVYGKCEKSSF